MLAASATAGVALTHSKTEFAGPVVPELVAAMINGGTFQTEMSTAGGELIVEVNDDLGFVLVHLADEEFPLVAASLPRP